MSMMTLPCYSIRRAVVDQNCKGRIPPLWKIMNSFGGNLWNRLYRNCTDFHQLIPFVFFWQRVRLFTNWPLLYFWGTVNHLTCGYQYVHPKPVLYSWRARFSFRNIMDLHLIYKKEYKRNKIKLKMKILMIFFGVILWT